MKLMVIIRICMSGLTNRWKLWQNILRSSVMKKDCRANWFSALLKRKNWSICMCPLQHNEFAKYWVNCFFCLSFAFRKREQNYFSKIVSGVVYMAICCYKDTHNLLTWNWKPKDKQRLGLTWTRAILKRN